MSSNSAGSRASSGRIAALIVTVPAGIISLAFSGLFAAIALTTQEDPGALWVMCGFCIYLVFVSLLCILFVGFRWGRSPVLLVAALLVVPVLLLVLIVAAEGPWVVLFIPIPIAVAFVLVGVALAWRVSS